MSLLPKFLEIWTQSLVVTVSLSPCLPTQTSVFLGPLDEDTKRLLSIKISTLFETDRILSSYFCLHTGSRVPSYTLCRNLILRSPTSNQGHDGS